MAARRGRTMGFEMSNAHRVKIQNSNILNALVEHVEGKRDMSATQVTAGLGLLRKVMPDLSQSEHFHEHSKVEELTDAEIAERLAELRGRAQVADRESEPPLDPSQLN